MRAAACSALLLMLGLAPAHAQEVQVFSEGKPFAISDEINAAFAPARDERKARKPLGERADASAIAAAYVAATLRCGVSGSSSAPADKGGGPEELLLVRDGAYIPIAGTRKIILLGEFARGRAIIDTDKRTVLTPQCPAGVRSMFWSYSAQRVVFAAQAVTGIDTHGAGSALWTARFAEANDVYYIDMTRAGAKFRKLYSLPDEKVLDVVLPDNTDHIWVLSQAERTNLPNPNRKVRLATITPEVKMDIYLRQIDLKGNVLDTVEVARAVPDGSAHFVRD